MLSFKRFTELESRQVQEGVANPMMVNDKELRYLDSLIDRGRHKAGEYESKAKAMIRDMYERYAKKFEKIKKKLGRIISKEVRKLNKSEKVKVFTDIKELDSIEDKAMDRNRGIIQMNDIVRGAVLFTTKVEADEFVSKFTRRNRSMIVAYEEKKRGGDTEYGYYGSHHLDLSIEGMVVELQVMTRKMWSYKEAAHDIYNKYRSKSGGPDKFDKHMSKRMFSMANESVGIDPEFTLEEIVEMGDTWEEVDIDAVLREEEIEEKVGMTDTFYPSEVMSAIQAWGSITGRGKPREISSTRKISNTDVSATAIGIGNASITYKVGSKGIAYTVTTKDGKEYDSEYVPNKARGQDKAKALGKVLRKVS
jgi:ppGpp synthetase/RelA/SpoT-type nucleotidyltranferase